MLILNRHHWFFPNILLNVYVPQKSRGSCRNVRKLKAFKFGLMFEVSTSSNFNLNRPRWWDRLIWRQVLSETGKPLNPTSWSDSLFWRTSSSFPLTSVDTISFLLTFSPQKLTLIDIRHWSVRLVINEKVIFWCPSWSTLKQKH